MDEREFELINIIGGQLASNQRELSRSMDLSLGMTNMLIRRLLSKGYIRIKQLNKKKVEYILTPKGFAEKMRKSIKYTLKTINSISLTKESAKKVVSRIYAQGHRRFFILGTSDVAILVEMCFRDLRLSDVTLNIIENIQDCPPDGYLLVCRESVVVGPGVHYVDLLEEMANDQTFVGLSIGAAEASVA